MSTKPYSIDLREKVIKFLEEGGLRSKAAKIFKMSPTTISTWYTRYKCEGNYNPKKRLGAKPKINSEDFMSYIENNPNITASEIGKKFAISASGAKYWLKKLNFTFKKKRIPMWKQMKESV